MIREKSPAKPEPVGLAAERTGCWDSELVRAEYRVMAGSVRLHWSHATRNDDYCQTPHGVFLPHPQYFLFQFALAALHILLSDGPCSLKPRCCPKAPERSAPQRPGDIAGILIDAARDLRSPTSLGAKMVP
jgi:hypothetical protein